MRRTLAFLLPLAALSACRDSPTSPPEPGPPPDAALIEEAVGRAQLLGDPLTQLVVQQLRVRPGVPVDQSQPFTLDEPLDSADVAILQAVLELILESAKTLPADSGAGGQ